MVAYTPRHALPYPTTGDPLSTVDNTLQALADSLDEKLDIRADPASNLKYARNLAYFEEQAPNLAGYIVVQTGLTMGNYMIRLDIRGYTYSPMNNIIDLSITMYGFQADNTFYSIDVLNKGTMSFTDIRLMTRTADGRIAVGLYPETPSNYWQYPKVAVDAYVGHTQATTSQLSGWAISRQALLGNYTLKKQGLPGMWQALPFVNSWTNYDTTWQQARFKKVGPIVTVQGLVRSGTPGAHIGGLPEGFRPGGGKLIFPSQTDTGAGRVDVDAFGNVTHNGGGTAYFSLSNIQFIAER